MINDIDQLTIDNHHQRLYKLEGRITSLEESTIVHNKALQQLTKKVNDLNNMFGELLKRIKRGQA